MILQTYWILLIFVIVFMVFHQVTIPLELHVDQEKISEDRESTVTLKKVVAYSLNKQIELDGEEYFCAKDFGNISSGKVKYSTEFWSKVENTEIYVTSVTLDKRLHPFYYLRIVAVIEGSWNETIYCQLLTTDGHVRVIKSTVTPIWYEKWDTNDNNTYYNPTLMSCRLPTFENLTSLALGLSANPCVLPSTFQKIYMPSDRKEVTFTICVKPLNFEKDISTHLVQWIEICKILGAQYFHIFLKNVTKNTRRVLETYKYKFPAQFDIEDFRPVDLESQNCTESCFRYTWQRRRYEVATYNKCFNKNLNSKYIMPLDIDEVIVPKFVRHWQDLLNHLEDNYSSLIVQNTYFFGRNNNHKSRYSMSSPFFLSAKRRIKVPSEKGENGKSFISTKNALTVFNHYALHSLRPGAIKEYFLPFRDVQLNHYKESCNYVIFPDCARYLSSPTVFDDVIFKYKDEFNERYKDVLRKLKGFRIN